uniref:Bromo domain-containing protein n=1 Tax=Dunaliella tertiolecta TaxID=3047 RepID=A0A7S3R877_DUNTE
MDGLAPVRSSKQDQIHNSIVSTLLALMDGLDARGKVVVIGATNRVDAIDGALRRPGRFDRELLFPLPNLQARRCILDIHTAKWAQPPSPSLRQELAAHCAGYCGADLKALCAEAALAALRRRYPQIYESDQRLVVDPASVRVERQDFFTAAASITPSSHRSAAAHAHPLTPVNAPCLGSHLSDLLASLCSTFPPAAACMAAAASQDDSALNPQNLHRPLLSSAAPVSPPLASSSLAAPAAGVGAAAHTAAPTSLLLPSRHAVKHCLLRPRLLLCGPEGSGAPALAAALLSAVEGLPVHSVGLPALLSDPGARSLEEALVHVVVEARRAAPAVLYLPHIQLWWTTAPPALRAVLIMLLEDLPPDTPLLLLATANTAAAELEPELLDLFNPVDGGQVVELTTPPPASARAAMLAPLLHEAALPPPPLPPPAPSSSGAHRDGQQQQQQQQQQGHEELPVDMAAVAARQEEEEARQALLMRQRYEADQAALRGLRMGLRDVTLRLLGDRRWRDFAAPVDPEEDPEYWQTVRCPCDLATILAHVDSRHYNTAAAYLAHVALIGKGWREYFEVDEQQQYHHQQQQQQQQQPDQVHYLGQHDHGDEVGKEQHALQQHPMASFSRHRRCNSRGTWTQRFLLGCARNSSSRGGGRCVRMSVARLAAAMRLYRRSRQVLLLRASSKRMLGTSGPIKPARAPFRTGIASLSSSGSLIEGWQRHHEQQQQQRAQRALRESQHQLLQHQEQQLGLPQQPFWSRVGSLERGRVPQPL